MDHRHVRAALLLACGLLVARPGLADEPAGPVAWQRWDLALLERAGRESRYVLLHMAAVWCHWCHVMERTTYRDAAVVAKLAGKFIPVRVDQDSDPDLSYRYEAWGWPATIILDAAGNEIFRRRGYVPPELFVKLLDAVIEDPSALDRLEIAVRADERPVLDAATRAALEAHFVDSADREHGGFGTIHRFIHGDSVEHALDRARALRRNRDAAPFAAIARKTLDGGRRLVDPAWGGMYQYSDALDWSSPHYEKLLNIQRDALRVYTLAWQQHGQAADLATARDVARWLLEHMRSPEGAFYASQDADAGVNLAGAQFYARDDAARRAGPVPRIDRSLYARETAWAAAGLATLYDVTADPAVLAAATQAMEWLLANRRAPSGGFGHARATDADVHLGDTLAVGEAALALYRSSGERRWLALAIELAHVIDRDHRDGSGGFVVRRPAPGATGVFATPVRQIDENVATVRFLNLTWRYSAVPALRGAAEHGMLWLAAVAREGLIAPGVLLADRELAQEPAHITIVGSHDDPAAHALHAAARRYPTRYLRLEWLDRREGPLPNPDVDYPDLPQAAAYACANGACSLPVFEPDAIAAMALRLEDR